MKRVILAVALSCLCLAPTAHAQMGGGMAPSSSMPQRDPNVPFQAGVAALNSRNYPEAIRQFNKARRGRTRDATLNYMLGLAYKGNGDREEARSAFERSVRVSSAPPAARMQLGLVALELGDREAAVAQQASLQSLLDACGARCSDEQRTQLQSALTQLTQALATP